MILICFGTRPEYLKLKSLINNLPKIKTCFTGQQKDLVNIKTDYQLKINQGENRLNQIFISILNHSYIFNEIDYVIIQGDTSSACAIALSAFHHQKKIIHLEAGLRTNDKENPFPEEVNRQIISRMAILHLCPTIKNKQNLINEKVTGQIEVVGNTGLDNLNKDNCYYGNEVLITLHRRDNLELMNKWFEEIEKISNKYLGLKFIIIKHPNPVFSYDCFNKVKVINNLKHEEMLIILKRCKFVISDSGGLQEECNFLNKKIIVCRKKTEREEIIGNNGYLCDKIDKLEELVDIVSKNPEYKGECFYGDGESWKKIIKIIERLN